MQTLALVRNWIKATDYMRVYKEVVYMRRREKEGNGASLGSEGFFLGGGGALTAACVSSWARDQTCATAVTQATAVTS